MSTAPPDRNLPLILPVRTPPTEDDQKHSAFGPPPAAGPRCNHRLAAVGDCVTIRLAD
jgi:hypothetical protein